MRSATGGSGRLRAQDCRPDARNTPGTELVVDDRVHPPRDASRAGQHARDAGAHRRTRRKHGTSGDKDQAPSSTRLPSYVVVSSFIKAIANTPDVTRTNPRAFPGSIACASNF